MVESEKDVGEGAFSGDANSAIQGLIRLARQRGYVSLDDINDALPGSMTDPKGAENIMSILENLDIEILDTEEIEQYQSKAEEEMAAPKAPFADTVEDPVRMYLRQMGQVPLLTRAQEVSISKTIEREERRTSYFPYI